MFYVTFLPVNEYDNCNFLMQYIAITTKTKKHDIEAIIRVCFFENIVCLMLGSPVELKYVATINGVSSKKFKKIKLL